MLFIPPERLVTGRYYLGAYGTQGANRFSVYHHSTEVTALDQTTTSVQVNSPTPSPYLAVLDRMLLWASWVCACVSCILRVRLFRPQTDGAVPFHQMAVYSYVVDLAHFHTLQLNLYSESRGGRLELSVRPCRTPSLP